MWSQHCFMQFQVMAWCHQATSLYPKQWSQTLMMPYGVTRPQRVNIIRLQTRILNEKSTKIQFKKSFRIHRFILIVGWSIILLDSRKSGFKQVFWCYSHKHEIYSEIPLIANCHVREHKLTCFTNCRPSSTSEVFVGTSPDHRYK